MAGAIRTESSREEPSGGQISAWYVARTKPRRERQTAVVLGEKGVEAYFPLFAPSRRRPREIEPLFPGYLFVRLNAEATDWLQVRSAPGIVYFLGNGGAGDRELPTAVPDELVEEIRARVARQEVGLRQSEFSRGERVVIVGGPLDGIEAVFDGELSATGRSRVLVELVSRLVPVSVDHERLSRVAPAI